MLIIDVSPFSPAPQRRAQFDRGSVTPLPKLRVSEDFAERNRRGGYTYVFNALSLRRGMTQRRPTSFDIAALAGVSQPTVSRALSRQSRRSAKRPGARVLAAAEQLNYKVDKNASGLRAQQSRTLALLFFEEPSPDGALINPFYLSLLGPMVRRCAERGYDLLISFQQLSSDWHVDYEDSRKADGIILLGYGDYLEYQPKLEKLIDTRRAFRALGLGGRCAGRSDRVVRQ